MSWLSPFSWRFRWSVWYHWRYFTLYDFIPWVHFITLVIINTQTQVLSIDVKSFSLCFHGYHKYGQRYDDVRKKLVDFDHDKHELAQKVVRSYYVNSLHLLALNQVWTLNEHWKNQQKHSDEQADCVYGQNCENLLFSLNCKLIWKVFSIDVTWQDGFSNCGLFVVVEIIEESLAVVNGWNVSKNLKCQSDYWDDNKIAVASAVDDFYCHYKN